MCKNALLAADRARKRADLLEATERDLTRLQARIRRARQPLRGAAAIGQAVGAVLGRRKVAKHFHITITEDDLAFARDTAAIAAEAGLDGFYVLRTSLPAEALDAAGTVRAYKGLARVERAFRCLKTVDLEVRPVFMGFGSYQTAWSWLHKIRRAMVRPERAPLGAQVEADETYVGGPRPGRSGRGAAGKTTVAGAVETGRGQARGCRLGRLRLAVVPDVSARSLEGFLGENVAKPATVTTDGWSGYTGLAAAGYAHQPINLAAAWGDAALRLPAIHLVFGLAKRWLLGTHHGAVSNKHCRLVKNRECLDEIIVERKRVNERAVALIRQWIEESGDDRDPDLDEQRTEKDQAFSPRTMLIFLDTKLLWLLAHPRGGPEAKALRVALLRRLEAGDPRPGVS